MPNIPNIQPDPLLPQYRYNQTAGRYIDSNGRFVSRKTVRRELDRVIDGISDDMAAVSERLRDGSISLDDWYEQMRDLTKSTHLASGAYERGGWYHMTQSDFGRVGQITRREYGYLDNFAQQIASGEQKLDGTLARRARLYGQQSRQTYYAFAQNDLRGRGFDEERSVLHPADHCRSKGDRVGCVEEAAKGWQPMGEMVPIGRRVCLSNDRCSVDYRNSQTDEVVSY